MTDEPDQLLDPATVMASLAGLLIRRLRVLQSPHEDVITLQTHYTMALWAVAKFLTAAGEKDVAERFDELAAAISGLQRGIVTDPVRPAAIGGRAPDGLTKSLLRGDVVLGL